MDTEATTIRFPPGMLAEIGAALGYGDSRNQWVVDACRARLVEHTGRTAIPAAPPRLSAPAPRLTPDAGPPAPLSVHDGHIGGHLDAAARAAQLPGRPARRPVPPRGGGSTPPKRREVAPILKAGKR